MRNRATTVWVAFALAGVALPSLAIAQPIEAANGEESQPSADEMIDAAGWSLKAVARPGGTASEVDPLAPLGRADDAAGRSSEAVSQPIEATDASLPQVPADEAVEASETPSEALAQVANWVIASGDNGGMPFIVIDKVAAEVLLFDAEGQVVGKAAALLGVTPGDDSAPGVGDRELSEIKPEDRTTPAGRFVARFGPASGNRNVLWVDYATSISLHAVVTRNKKERRLQRLRSATPDDNRITFGCINVPAPFYEKVVRALLKDAGGVVYILPETKPLNEVFPMFRVQDQASFQVQAGR